MYLVYILDRIHNFSMNLKIQLFLVNRTGESKMELVKD